MRSSVLRRALLGVLLSCAFVVTGLTAVQVARADNVTVSGDTARTGWDSHEPGLAPSQVTASDFGQQFSTQLDGSIYAQPLVIGNTVVATTEKANAYGIDAKTGAVQWKRAFGKPFAADTVSCGDLYPDLGSTSTPVYDAASKTIYLTTKIDDGPDAQHPHWYLQAINPADGSDRPGFPVTLQGTAGNDPSVTFDPAWEMQRTGLLYGNGMVYIGFGSHCDHGPWRGYVMAVKTSGTPGMQSVWTSESQDGGGSGIWGAGGGLMSDGNDANGNPRIFLATGNGTAPPNAPGTSPQLHLGEAVVRIGLNASGQLAEHDFFAPENAPALNDIDYDLGSGAPAALPDSFGTASHPHLLVEDGKDGRVFLLDRDSLGGRGQGSGGTDSTVQTIGPYEGVWGHPAVYGGEGGWVYLVGSQGPLRAFQHSVTGGDPTLIATGASAETFGYTSGSPIITSDGTTAGSGLVWEVYSDNENGGNGQLRAYDTTPTNGVLKLRWSSSIGTASKFEMPATSGGRVYVGNRDGVLYAFGRPASVALTGQPVDVGQVDVGSSANGTAHFTASRTITVNSASTSAPFSVDGAVLPKTLNAADTLDLPVTFTPSFTGAASATLSLDTNLGPVTLDLHGTGTKPGLAATPSPLDFGTIATSTTKTRAVSITNTGRTDETVTATSAASAPFKVTGLPAVGTVIAPQQSLGVAVEYSPTAAGNDNASFSITSTNGNVVVNLAGNAVTGTAHLEFSPPTTDFGSVPVGTSRTLTFDIQNTGNIPLVVSKAKAPVGVFSSAAPLDEGTTIGPDDVVRQQVTFTPKATGQVSATYLISSTDGHGAQLETLTGSGVDGNTLPPPTGADWTLNGSAAASGNDLVLTSADNNLAGSAFSNATVPSDGLDAHFTAEIGGGNGGDGLTFTLADGADPATSLGDPGGGLGYGGIENAVAVTLDTFQHDTDPSGNFVGVAVGIAGTNHSLNYAATSTDIGQLTKGTHDVDVNVYGGRLSVSIDGKLKINVPVSVPTTVRPGFTAATGANTAEQHVVRNVAITTPSGKKASTRISTTASGATHLGGPVSDTATISGGNAPAGDVTFSLYGPGDTTCQTPLASKTGAISGGKASSGDIVANAGVGTYNWVASYPGDDQNYGATSLCGSETVEITKSHPTISTIASASVPAGGNVSDTATLANDYQATGDMTFTLYAPADTTCQKPIATKTVSLSSESASSGDVSIGAAGTYRWIASYSGDAENDAAASKCGDETVVVTPQTLTGRAYGLTAKSTLLGVTLVNVAPTPDTGSISTTTDSSTSVPCVAALKGLVSADGLCAKVATTAFPGKSVATASLADVGVRLVGIPAVSVGAIKSTSTTQCSGSAGSVTIDYLKVGGVVVISVPTTVAPNTTVNVGVIKLVLNEQTPVAGPDAGLTVTAVHLTVNAIGLARTDIKLAAAESDIGNCP